MGDDVNVNGVKLSWGQIIPVLMFTFWLGTLSLMVSSNAEDQKEHESLAAHTEAGIATTKIQSDVEHNKEAIEEVKEDLKDIKEQMSKDKDEILKAIREQ